MQWSNLTLFYYPPFSFIIASEKNGKRLAKIPQEIWVKLAFCLIYGSEIEFLSSCQSKIRQPWCADLGTLKIKFQIYRCWNSNSKNIGSYLIFRVTIYLEMAKLALIWQPWNEMVCKVPKIKYHILPKFCYRSLNEKISIVQLDVRCRKCILYSETSFQFLKQLSQNLGSMWYF